jgi:hypothetical protein
VGSSPGIVPNRAMPDARRTLQPAAPRSHDERCPSGSGWGSVLARGCRKAAVRGSRRQRKLPGEHAGYGFGRVQPLARETSAGDRLSPVERGFGLAPWGIDGAARTRCRDAVGWRGFGNANGREPSAATERMGFGLCVSKPTPESEASGARKRTLALLFAPGAGIGRSRGRARGLGWLQKSTSGAWSRSKGRGSSPLASALTPRAWAGLSG